MSLHFDFIGIVTSRLGESLRFYRELGVDVPDAPDDAPHVEAVLPNGMRLAWDPVETIRSFDAEFVPRAPGKAGSGIAFAFRAEDATGVDDAYARILAAGFSGMREPWDAPWGQRYATVLDPDGNAIDLYAPLGD